MFKFDKILSLPVNVAKDGIGTSTPEAPGVGYETIPSLETGKRTGRTSIGLGPSQGDILVLLSFLFLIESRNSTSFGLSPVPVVAAIDSKVADAFLPPIAAPEIAVRMAELSGARLAIESDRDPIRLEDLLIPLARVRPGLAS